MVTTRQADTSMAVLAPPKASLLKSNNKTSSPSNSSSTKRVAAAATIKPPAVRPRRIQKFAVRKHNTKFSKKNANPTETVEVVKMLTGILYLYRGSNPRAEFVRKV